jgi:hypothetical protein
MKLETNNEINQQENIGEPAPPTQGNTNTTERTFTQADLDRIVKERLADERKKYADYGTVKDQLTALTTERGTWEQSRQTLESTVSTAKERANTAVMELALYKAAAKAKFIDPADVFGAVDKSKITIAEDGTINGVEEAIQALSESKPHWIQGEPVKPGAPKVSATNPGGTTTLTADALSKMSVQDINALPWDAVKTALKNPK